MKTFWCGVRVILGVAMYVVVAAGAAVAQPQADKARQQAQLRQYYKTVPPARTVYNRGRKAVRLTLSQRGSTVLLPPGWKCRSRSMAHGLTNRSASRYEHFLSPLRGNGGILILILSDSSGGYGELLNASKLPPRPDGLAYRPWTLKGLKGFLLAAPAGAQSAQIVERHHDFLGIRHKPRYVLAVGTPDRFYGIEDSTALGTPGARTVLDSFQPR